MNKIDLSTTSLEPAAYHNIEQMNPGPERDAFATATVSYALMFGLYNKALEFQRLITEPREKFRALNKMGIWLSQF
jgi:hypothetical protein